MDINQVKDYYNSKLDYFKTDNCNAPRHRHIGQTLKKIIRSDMNVLDLGCGTGISSKTVAEMGAKVWAIDIADELIEYAKENNSHGICPQNILYEVADITEYKCIDVGINFGAILLIDCFEHILPDRIISLLNVIKEHSHKDTFIYLNIPDGRYTRYLKKNAPDKLQIIDEVYEIGDILRLFKLIDLECVYFNIYGIMSDVQYNEYVFTSPEILVNHYRKIGE